MIAFAIDASVALSLIFEDEASPYSDAVANNLEVSQAVAPIVWPLEIANAILTAVRRGRIPSADAPLECRAEDVSFRACEESRRNGTLIRDSFFVGMTQVRHAAVVFGAMNRLRVEIDQGIDPEFLARVILNLGMAHRLSAYDASYLELAIRRGVPLATLDQRLRDAAIAAGVKVYQP